MATSTGSRSPNRHTHVIGVYFTIDNNGIVSDDAGTIIGELTVYTLLRNLPDKPAAHPGRGEK
jgi:hypothetical protein